VKLIASLMDDLDAPVPVAVISDPQDLKQQNIAEDNDLGDEIEGGMAPRMAMRRLMSSQDTGCACGMPGCPMCKHD
jgi:hypothetical protein